MDCGIYQILHKESNKRYIGSSKNLYKRKWEHLKRLRTNKHCNKYLQSAWNKYGESSFEIKTILICEIKDLLFYEDLIIKGYQSNISEFGYNLREVTGTNQGMSLKYKVGDTFERVTLLEPKNSGYWLCQCSCGKIKIICVYSLKRGAIKSCGCLNKQNASALMKKQHNDPE